MWLSALNMTWMFCEVYWDLELELVKTSGGQLVAFGGGFGIWLPWVLNPEIPVAASQWYLDCTGTPNRAKSYTRAAQVDLPRFLDGKWKHAVSHVLRVYEFGHGNVSSRTSLIILVFGEFGTPGLGGTCSVLALWCAACPSGEWAIVAGDSKEVWALRWRQIHLSHLNLSVSSTVCRLVNSVKVGFEWYLVAGFEYSVFLGSCVWDMQGVLSQEVLFPVNENPFACGTCGKQLTRRQRQEIALAAQRAQDAQTGYCCDYCAKNQPMGTHEIKEFQKGHVLLNARLQDQPLVYGKADEWCVRQRHCPRPSRRLQFASKPQTRANGGSRTHLHDRFRGSTRARVYSDSQKLAWWRHGGTARTEIHANEANGGRSAALTRSRYSARLRPSTVWYGMLVAVAVWVHHVLGLGPDTRAANAAGMGRRRSSYVGCDTDVRRETASPKT